MFAIRRVFAGFTAVLVVSPGARARRRARAAGRRRRRLRRHVRRRRRRGAGGPDGQDRRPHRAGQAPRRADHRRPRRHRHRQQGGHRRHLPRVLSAGSQATTPARRLEPAERATTIKASGTTAERRHDVDLRAARRRGDLREMLAEAKVPVVLGERLDLTSGVQKDGRPDRRDHDGERPTSSRQDVHRRHLRRRPDGQGRRLLHVGREANAKYGETLNGVQLGSTTATSSRCRSIPTSCPATPRAACCPASTPAARASDGEGDQRVQAYNFRMCLTDVPENRIPFPKPAGYDPLRYELLAALPPGRRVGRRSAIRSRRCPTARPTRTTTAAFSTDNIGMNYDYPDGDYATRERDLAGARHLPAGADVVPRQRSRACPRRFATDDEPLGPVQGRIRRHRRLAAPALRPRSPADGRRLRDDRSTTASGARPSHDPVGLAAYTMDSHNTQRYVDRTATRATRATCRSAASPPYPIAYRSIVPQGERVHEPARAGLPVGVAHRLRLDPHGAGLHGPRPVGGDGRLPGDRPRVPVQRIDVSALQAL